MSPAPVRIASAVALTRDNNGVLEILLGERNPKLRFFGGYWAFPGGVLDDEIDERGSSGEALRACAVRELHEETGVSFAAGALVELGVVTTPAFVPVRYETNFFHAELSENGEPLTRNAEFTELRFWQPREALAA